jgi:hypothetical protein
MSKENLVYYIGVCVPCGASSKKISIAKNIDNLSCDLLAEPKLKRFFGMTKRECIKEFKLINNIKRMGVLE